MKCYFGLWDKKMWKLAKGSPEDIDREKPAEHNRSRIVGCFKRFAWRAQLVLLAFIICVIAPAGRRFFDGNLFTVALAQKPAPEKSDAQKSFSLMKTLAGNWRGPATTIPQMPDMIGATVQVSLRVTSGGAALMHEMGPEGRTADPTNGDDDPITMLYIDGDRLLLTHYCDTWGNRPRMSGKLLPDGKTVEFEFLDVAGTKRGYMSHAVFTFIDTNHHTEDWTTTMSDGGWAVRTLI
jgi:hypothetical protein